MDDSVVPDQGSVRDYIQKQPKIITVPVGQPPLHKPKQVPKLIITTGVHHRNLEGKALSQTCRAVRELKSEDDAFTRRMKIGEQWVPVDTAWVKDIGYLFLRNDGGPRFNIVPNEDQLAEARAKIVEVGYMLCTPEQLENERDRVPATSKHRRTMWDKPEPERKATVQPIPLWFIHPGEKIDGKANSQYTIYLRCQKGETTVTLFVIPD